MKRAAVVAAFLPLLAAAPAPSAPIKLWRLDCGAIWIKDLDSFSDTRAYVGQSRELVASCYLIKHGETYMLWDTGFSRTELGKPLDHNAEGGATLHVSLLDQLKQLGIKPEQISLIGISHYHGDHTGQAGDFPAAKLMIGKGDVDAMKETPARATALKHWMSEGGALEPITGDKDVFGDGSVVMLDLPGHTPGHHGLMVHLEHKGWVILSGDAAHLRENYENDGVPPFNVDRAKTLASLDRFHKLAANLKATVVVQHEPRDVAKLPAFPQAAE
ncbi:MAG: N-acyl homoserine lactonase family protein [Proteobacteria bacterium]|nr:N-acyl homoserine lactonase family protein [Pseudomonadota bacterium]